MKWPTYEIMHSVCRIDVSKFPFDTQKCPMKIGSWTQDVSDLDLKLHVPSNGIDLNVFETNNVWELKSARAQRNAVYYPCCSAPYIDITYTFEFRRKPLYYIMTIIYPSILLTLLASISFIFPADSGERVSLVISVLLGLIVFMLIVNDRTPVTSDNVPMITQFFNSIGATTVLALLATAFILRLNHVSSDQHVPHYLARIRDCIAGALCIKDISKKSHSNSVEEVNEIGSSTQVHLDLGNLGNQTCMRLNMTPNSNGSSTHDSLKNIQKELRKLSKYLEDETAANELKTQWHYTMRVFDKFFFLLFFLIFLGFSAEVLFVYASS